MTGRPHVQGIGGFLYVDPLAVFFAITVSLVVVLAAFGSAAYMRVEEDRGELSSFQVRLYFVFFSVFASGMLGSLFAGNLGLLWVLIEASTLASAALVGLEAKARSLERPDVKSAAVQKLIDDMFETITLYDNRSFTA